VIVTKPRRRSAAPESQRPKRTRKSSAPVPRYSTHRPTKRKAKPLPEVVISDLVEEVPPPEPADQARELTPTTRPPPPGAEPLRWSEPRLKRGEVSQTSVADLIAELMVDLASGASKPSAPAPSGRGKKDRLPKAVVDEVVADRKKDPRREED
jgi:hypothetical protein